MTRRWGGGTALLLAALLSAACTEKVVLDHPVGAGGGGGAFGLGGGIGNGGNGFGDGGVSDAAGDSRLHCSNGQSIAVNVSQEVPSIMFAVDRSPTMRMPLDGTMARFAVTRDAINAALNKYQQLATFGYVEFPGDGNDSSCGDCCAGGFVPLISPSNTNNAQTAIMPMMNQCWSLSMQQYNCIGSSESPSGQALQKIARTFRNTSTSAGQLYALLLTDGPPSCAVFDPMAPDFCDQTASQISDMNIGPPKIGTFVVVLGTVTDSKNIQCFNNLASAGATSGGGSSYYPADTEALVGFQIDRILSSTVCRLNISPNQQPFDQNPARIEVDVKNGQPILNTDASNGYAVTTTASGTHIDFVGTACTMLIGALKSSPRSISVRGCQPLFPSPPR